MFINRGKELSFLEDRYKEPGSQLIVLRGERRAGKTELARHFVKNKPHL